MTLKEGYEQLGMDYEGVIGRLGTDALLKRFVIRFLDDGSFAQLEQALGAGDVETAFRAAHTLKGLCLNLGFSGLYEPTAELTERLRAGSMDGCSALFARTKEEYQKLSVMIETLKQEG